MPECAHGRPMAECLTGREMENSALLWILLLSACLVVFMHVPGIKTGINLADEGYLWYGTLKVLEGAVPIRDFRAYDPGRYYWCALWMRLLGRNLLSIRIAMIVTQTVALAAGASAVFIATGEWMAAIFASLALVAWMLPRYKQIDILFPMTAALMAVMLVGDPIPPYYLLSGIFVGVCLLFGLNHAIYAAGGLSLLILLMSFHVHGLALTASLAWYALGLGIGLLPVFAIFIFVPGLFHVYWQQKILKIFQRGTTNLSLPIPWVWRPMPAHMKRPDRWAGQVVRAGFTVMPIFYGLFLLPAVLDRNMVSPREWAVIAVSCVGVFYMHYAMSRADITHLAQASPPLIIGLVITLFGFSYGWIMVGGLIAVSLWFVYRPHELFVKSLGRSIELNRIEFGGNSLWLPAEMALYLAKLRDLVDAHSQPGDPVLFAPKLVTLYPLLARRPAVYDIFCVYPATEEEQTLMINQLVTEGTRLALIANHPVDSRDELRFSNTHPRVWEYLNREFTVLDIAGQLPANHYLFVRPK